MTAVPSLAQTRLTDANLQFSIDDYDRRLLERYASAGAVFVCNRLVPGFDEWVVLALLGEYYPSVRLLHPYPLAPARALRTLMVAGVPLSGARGGDRARPTVERPNLARRIERLVTGGTAVALAVDFSDNWLGDGGRNLLRRQMLRQVQRSGQVVVPVHLTWGRRPAAEPAESLAGGSICVRIGNAIHPADTAALTKMRTWSRFLQASIFALGSPFEVEPERFSRPGRPRQEEPVAAPIDAAVLADEVANLTPAHHVAGRGNFDVYIARHTELPNVLLEIARLREHTFRLAGEGTGRARDLDEYDLYYYQLFIWDRTARQIVGGYRLGPGDAIFAQFGVNGFYTSSLFKLKKKFFPILQQAVELGRSFVVPEYQRHRLPLFLLWKGILAFMLAHPQYRFLYGPVSISRDYSDASKSVLVEFIKRYCFNTRLARWVEPRKPFRPKIKALHARLLAETFHGEFDALDHFIETIEPHHLKIPVLFRQYLKQNARFIAFNVDPAFADCLDGLMILDFKELPEGTIEALNA